MYRLTWRSVMCSPDNQDSPAIAGGTLIETAQVAHPTGHPNCRQAAIVIVAAQTAANVRRHGIAFEDAPRLFHYTTVERTDDRYDYGEVRIYAIGLVNGVEITVVYTDRDLDERHIISAWRSEPHERRYFWNHLED